MKIQTSFFGWPLAVLVLTPALGLLAGCGNNDVIKEDPSVTKKRVETAATLQSFYQKSNGNYDALSPEDKAAMNAQTGSEAHSRTAMGYMKGGTGPKGH